MLLEIIKHTPIWVFALFFALLVLGLSQRKERAIPRNKVFRLPLVMLVLSFVAVYSAFGLTAIGLIPWVVGMAFSLAIAVKLTMPQGVNYCPATQTVNVPGSLLPLALMMAIFFIKYSVGIIMARQIYIAGEPIFIGAVSLCYGLFSGIFLARAMVIWRAVAMHSEAHVSLS